MLYERITDQAAPVIPYDRDSVGYPEMLAWSDAPSHWERHATGNRTLVVVLSTCIQWFTRYRLWNFRLVAWHLPKGAPPDATASRSGASARPSSTPTRGGRSRSRSSLHHPGGTRAARAGVLGRRQAVARPLFRGRAGRAPLPHRVLGPRNAGLHGRTGSVRMVEAASGTRCSATARSGSVALG